MIVKELINELSKHNPDFEVKFFDDDLGGWADICKVYEEPIFNNTVVLEDECMY